LYGIRFCYGAVYWLLLKYGLVASDGMVLCLVVLLGMNEYFNKSTRFIDNLILSVVYRKTIYIKLFVIHGRVYTLVTHNRMPDISVRKFVNCCG
jgi:hypothetical protein